MDEADSGDFRRPDDPNWDLFEDAAIKIYYEWEITQHATDDEWAGGLTEEYVERVLDHLLENFAERWLQGKQAKQHSVADFFTDAINDHFDVEVPHAIAIPIARVLVTLHEECRNGVLTGVTHILGEERVQKLLEQAAKVKLDESQAKSSEPPLAAAPSPRPGGAEEEEKKADAMDVEPNRAAAAPASQVDDDGWTTVTTGKKKGKKKGKQME